MGQVENTWEIVLIDNEHEKMNELLEQAENRKHKIALWILNKIDSDVPKYDIDLAIDRSDNTYRIIWNDNVSFNLSLDLDSLDLYCDDIIKLLNYDWDIQLIWWKEWRAIAEKNLIWWSALADRLVNNSQEHWLTDEHNRSENNKTEELFKFVQTLKWVPIEDWIISDSIKKSWPIWIQRSITK